MSGSLEVTVWIVDTATAAAALDAFERENPRLAPDEEARATALMSVDREEAAHWRTLRIALRMLLEQQLGAAVRGAPYAQGARGKPYLPLEGATFDFSVSHAAGMGLIGLAGASSIGVDLESMRPLRLAPSRCCAVGAAAVALLGEAGGGPADSDGAVLQAWTVLEAFAKARGTGLARLLSDLDFSRAGRADAPAADLAALAATAERLRVAAGLTVRRLDLGPGLYGAVAAAGLPVAVRADRFPLTKAAIAALLLP
jgi:phosphopantetheinyl transferase